MENITIADLARELGKAGSTLKSFVANHGIPTVVMRIEGATGGDQITLPRESAQLLRTLYTNTKNGVDPNTYTYRKMEANHKPRTCPTCQRELPRLSGRSTYCSSDCYNKRRCTSRDSVLQVSQKGCIVCRRVLPIDHFYTYGQKPINTCKECHCKRNKERYRTNLQSRLRSLAARSHPHRSKRRFIPSTLTLADLEKVYDEQNGLCYYTKQPLSLDKGPNAISLDRRDPNGAYELGNIALTSWLVNRIKSDLPEQEFIRLCRLVAENTP